MESEGRGTPNRWPARALAGILVLTAIAYLPVFRNEWVFDDFPYILENPMFVDGVGPDIFRDAFTKFHAANWHPLTWLSHGLDVAVFGMSPDGPHAVNIGLHLANVALLFLLLRGLTRAPWPSLLVAGLFALHPLNVESVAWVAERKNLLSTLFGLLAIRAYASWAWRPTAGRYGLLLAAMAASLLAKPMLVTLPFLLLLLDFWPLARIGPRVSLLRAMGEKAPLLVLSVASSIVTVAAQRADTALTSLRHVPLWTRLANMVLSYGRYVEKTVLPRDLAAFYPHPLGDIPWAGFAASAVLVAAVSFVAFRCRRTRPFLAVGWLWFLGAMVPVIGIVQVGLQALADRYAYVPHIGLFVAAAFSLPGLAESARRAAAHLAAFVLLVLGVLTFLQVPTWRDSITLFAHALRASPDNFFAHYNYAVALAEAKRFEEAKKHYLETIRLQPRHTEALNNLGVILCGERRYSEAATYFERAVGVNPRFAEALMNLGASLSDAGRLEEAIPYIVRAIEIEPLQARGHRNLGITCLRLKRYAEAADSLERALRYEPSPVTENDLGFALEKLGRLEEAAQHYRRSLSLYGGPDNPAHANLRRIGPR